MEYPTVEDITVEQMLRAKGYRWRGGEKPGYYIYDVVIKSRTGNIPQEWHDEHVVIRLWSREIAIQFLWMSRQTKIRHRA